MTVSTSAKATSELVYTGKVWLNQTDQCVDLGTVCLPRPPTASCGTLSEP